MEPFFSFLETNLDWMDLMQLTDIAKVLAEDQDAIVEFDLYARIEKHEHKFYVSRFWDFFDEESKSLGRKSDVYLRSFGNIHFSDLSVFSSFLDAATRYRNPKFAKQLFCLLEDLRIEKNCLDLRPGMIRAFTKRKELYQKNFLQKLRSSISHDYDLDKLFYRIYLHATKAEPFDSAITSESRMSVTLAKITETESTQDVMSLCQEIMAVVDQQYTKDCQEQFFGISSQTVSSITFDDLCRKDEVISTGKKDQENDQNKAAEEKMMTWHQDTETSEQSLLQFDVEEGTNTDVVGDDVRMSDANDQVFASIQGNSVQTNKRSYDIQNLLEKKMSLENTDEDRQAAEYKGPVAIHLDPFAPNYKEWGKYQEIALSLAHHQMALVRTLEKYIEHQRNEHRSNLLKGRLGKKLIPLVTDENPRPFIKRQQESKQKDAVFSLLIDCSSSMSTKMDKVQKAAILFHETLQALMIPHNVIGFWEESSALKKGVSNNYFQPVITYDNCDKRLVGCTILQMEPQEDNRDGFAIREGCAMLRSRREKQKFLLVFSDGEPSAANYGEDGVLDTYKAVAEARKHGINVIGLYLSNKELNDKDFAMMKMLYGNFYVALHDMEYLAESVATLLGKLLVT
ncbi:vWA domain-containing protein [Brevibacillus ginsengisoli]|uniref:vWA domain-containing protein n=1 Tax=Brevibacillus ginsengisoli TaxID=363854 RepID=UPI003CED86FF